MIQMENIMAIPTGDGFHIGKPFQAFIDKDTMKLKAVLCQLLGLPKSYALFDVTDGMVNIEDDTIEISSGLHPVFFGTMESGNIMLNSRMIPLRGLPLFCQYRGVVGFIEDFDIDNDTLELLGISTLVDNWKFDDSFYLKGSNGEAHIVFNSIFTDRKTLEHPFFGKSIIQKCSEYFTQRQQA